MNPLSIISVLVEALGEAAEDTVGWTEVSAFLKQVGAVTGLPIEIIEAAENSSNFVQFAGLLESQIAGGDVGAAAAVRPQGLCWPHSKQDLDLFPQARPFPSPASLRVCQK